MKSDIERGTWGAWARRQRADRDWSVEEVVSRLLSDARLRVDPATVRGIEGGSKKPSVRLQDGLALIYGSRPEEPQRAPTEPTDVAAAIDRQTAVIRELVEELRLSRSEAPAWVDGLVLALVGTRAERDSAAHDERPQSASPRRDRK